MSAPSPLWVAFFHAVIRCWRTLEALTWNTPLPNLFSLSLTRAVTDYGEETFLKGKLRCCCQHKENGYWKQILGKGTTATRNKTQTTIPSRWAIYLLFTICPQNYPSCSSPILHPTFRIFVSSPNLPNEILPTS